MKDFNEIKQQVQRNKILKEGFGRHTKVAPKKKDTKSAYQKFVENKYCNIEDYVDDFKPIDLVYFFTKCAREYGAKFSPIFTKDIPAFRRLRDTYTNKEICMMIEFLFNSDQNYLDKDTLRPLLLASNWQSTIYKDSLLWYDDKYTPRKIKEAAQREWKPQDKTKVGDWD